MKAFKKTLSCILALSITASMMTETLSLGASANATAASVSNVTDGDLDLGDPDPQADPAPQIAAVSSINKEIATTISSVALSKASKISIMVDDGVVDPVAPKVYADASELNFSGLVAVVEFDEAAIETAFDKPDTPYDAQNEDWETYDGTLKAHGLEIKLIDGTEPGDLVYAGIKPYVCELHTDNFYYDAVDTLVGKTSVTGNVTLVGDDYNPDDEENEVRHTFAEASYDLPVVQIAEIAINDYAEGDDEAFVGDNVDFGSLSIKKRYVGSEQFENDPITVQGNDKVTVSGASTESAGDKTVTIGYFGKTVTFTYKVKEDTVKTAELVGSWDAEDDGEFFVGDTVDDLYAKIYDSGISIYATWDSGKVETSVIPVTRTGDEQNGYTYTLNSNVTIEGFAASEPSSLFPTTS